LEYFFERTAKAQLAITDPYTQLASTLKTPYFLPSAEVRTARVPSGFGTHSLTALRFQISGPIIELFGQKRRGADKTDAAVSQLSEESDPCGVGE